MDRVVVRPRRKRERLDHEGGRQRAQADLKGNEFGICIAELDPGWAICAGLESGVRHQHVRDLDVSPPGRLGRANYEVQADAHDPSSGSAQCHRGFRITRRKISLLCKAHRRFHIRSAVPAMASGKARPQNRRRRHPDPPTGKQLPASAFARRERRAVRHALRSGLRLRNLQTGEDRWVKYPITRDDQESRFTRDLFPGYAFLPGGKEIVYTNDGKLHRWNIATGEEKLIPFTAQVSQELGPKLDFPRKVEEGPVKVRLIQDAVESPDGKRLAFSALTHLYVMDIPGGKPQRLTSGNAKEFQPAWSPDGKWITYVTWSAGGGQIWKVPASG